MKRLTDKRLAIPPGQWQEVTQEEARELKEIPIPSIRDLYYRLSQIEDILGDEYDLDELRELAQADREGRCVVIRPNSVTDDNYKIICRKINIEDIHLRKMRNVHEKHK